MYPFRHKPDKVKHLTVVQTLDELHKEKMAKFNSNFDKLEYISKTGNILMNYYDIVAGSYYNSSETEIPKETKETKEPKETNAFTNVSEGLKKLNELSQQNRKVKKQIKKRKLTNNNEHSKSILSFMVENQEPEKAVPEKPEMPNQSVNRAILCDQYKTIIDKNYACTKVKNSKILVCSQCNVEKTFDHFEGCYICKSCGESEDIIMENETAGHKETNNDKQKYPYKRMNHLKEKLNQFQSKETADVPDIVYTTIFTELKKKRIDPNSASSDDIKKILKKNRLTNFYEHLQQIYCKVTNCPPMLLNRETEEKIISMFQSMQASFYLRRPGTRSNFLSYSYILNKLFRIIDLEKYSQYFGLLKSKERLKSQDVIWKKICEDMKWRYHSSF